MKFSRVALPFLFAVALMAGISLTGQLSGRPSGQAKGSVGHATLGTGNVRFGRALGEEGGTEGGTAPAGSEAAGGENKTESKLEKKESKEVKEEKEKVQLAVAVLLFGFLVFAMVLLFMVNYGDPQIRAVTYMMIDLSLSIFCAVFINGAVVDFFIEQLWKGSRPGLGHGCPTKVTKAFSEEQIAQCNEANDTVEGIFQFIFFTVLIFSVNFVCFKLRDRKRGLTAASEIGAHLVGFAAVGTFNTMQGAYETNLKWNLLVILIAGGVSVIYCYIAGFLRECLKGGAEGEDEEDSEEERKQLSKKEKKKEKKEEEADEWIEKAADAENDAITICLSYLTQQALALWVTGSPQSMLDFSAEDKYDRWSVIHMAIAMGVVVVILMVVSAVFAEKEGEAKKAEEKRHEQFRKKIPGWLHFLISENPKERAVDLLKKYLSFTMGWCVLRIAYWTIMLPEIGLVTNYADLVTPAAAFIISAVSTVLVLALDFVADMMESYAERRKKRGEGARETVPAIGEGLPQFAEEDLDAVSAGVRNVLLGIALTTAMGWEKAFDASLDIITDGVFKTHAVMGPVALAVLVVVIVLPNWFKFILPNAMKNEHDHQAEIYLERAAHKVKNIWEESEDEASEEDDSEALEEKKKVEKALHKHHQKVCWEMKKDVLVDSIVDHVRKRQSQVPGLSATIIKRLKEEEAKRLQAEAANRR